METKFNFKSAICTSRSQSERLLSLGLKKETADMCWLNFALTSDYDDWRLEPIYKDWEDWQKYGIPAWSLHRLIEMMPMTLIEDRVYHERWDLNVTPTAAIYRNQDQPYEWIGGCFGQGMYNNIIDCIEWLIKEGYFPKEYLCEK